MEKIELDDFLSEICVRLTQGWLPETLDAERTADRLTRGAVDLDFSGENSAYLVRDGGEWRFRLRIRSPRLDPFAEDRGTQPLSARLRGGIRFHAEQSLVVTRYIDDDDGIGIELSCHEVTISTPKMEGTDVRITRFTMPSQSAAGPGNLSINNGKSTSYGHYVFDGAYRYLLVRTKERFLEWALVICRTESDEATAPDSQSLEEKLYAELLALSFLLGGRPDLGPLLEVTSDFETASESSGIGPGGNSRAFQPPFDWYRQLAPQAFPKVAEALTSSDDGRFWRIVCDRYLEAVSTAHITTEATLLFMIILAVATRSSEDSDLANQEDQFRREFERHGLEYPAAFQDLVGRFRGLVISGDSNELQDWAAESCEEESTFEAGVRCFRSVRWLVGAFLLRSMGYQGQIETSEYRNPLQWDAGTGERDTQPARSYHAESEVAARLRDARWFDAGRREYQGTERVEALAEFLGEIEFATAGRLFGILVPRFDLSEDGPPQLDARIVVTRSPDTQGTLFSVDDTGDRSLIRGWDSKEFEISTPHEMRNFCDNVQQSDSFRKRIDRFLAHATTLEQAAIVAGRAKRRAEASES